MKKWLSPHHSRTVLLIAFHLIYTFAAWRFSVVNGGDAAGYWFLHEDISEISWPSLFAPGTSLIRFLNFPCVYYLEMPFWAGFFLYSALGFIALLQFRKWAGEYLDAEDAAKWADFLLLLPVFHFWFCLIGKETFLFLALVCLVLAVSRLQLTVSAVLSFILILLLRPHLLIILSAALFCSLFFAHGISHRIRNMGALALIIAAAAGFLVLLELQDFTGGFLQAVHRKFQVHIVFMQHTGAYVPLERYPLPWKMFTFWFRPLPGERTGWLYTLWSLENAVFLMLFVAFCVTAFKKGRTGLKLDHTAVFLMVFALLYSGVLVFGYANYGLIYRSKALLVPFLMVMLLRIIYKVRSTAPPP